MEEKVKEENPNFRLKAVAELLDGDHHFMITSYQRGYRWGKKQVEDLLKDIWDFAKDAKQGDFYCLQPIVVKSKSWEDKDHNPIEGWEVIDGQQRLTSILLLLKYLRDTSDDAKSSPAKFFNIFYKTRPDLNFDNPEKQSDIDSYHAFTTKRTIEDWFSKNTVKKSKLVEVLFDDYSSENKGIPKEKWQPQVKVIWYVAENGNVAEIERDIESIKIFNNLNKGKIRLTNAELIKALFILRARDKEENLILNELAFEWNEMENALHDDKLWYFLANKEYKPATRIDIIFDFLTGKGEKDDSDFSYRKFQNLYDNTNDPFWKDKKVENFSHAWISVKEVFQTFIYWFEDSTLYHYIGYLIYWNIPLKDIFAKTNGKPKDQVIKEIQTLIKDKIFKDIKTPTDIDGLNYTENYDQCKRFLLFFNIETCISQQQNQNNENPLKFKDRDALTYYKFPFDLCKLYDWDIEHVDSKTDNPLTEVKDKIIWLSYAENINCPDDCWEELKKESSDLKKDLEMKKKDEGNKFEVLYKKIVAVIQKDVRQSEEQINKKDTIENLALLDAGTNRGYGNALFPTKRKIIIEKDKDGIFIPVCTKNLFLKYYTKDDMISSPWKNKWTDDDRKPYLTAIHETIDFILI